MCPYNHLGCSAKVTLPDIDSHISICTYKVSDTNSVKYPCLFYDVGCMNHFGSKEEMERHLSQNISAHLKVSKCFFNIYIY